MAVIYDILFVIAALLYIPYLTLRGKWHTGFRVRLGFIPSAVKIQLSRKKNIWIHAVSVGEVLVVLDLIGRIRARFPQYGIVCSTVTRTGYRLAKEKLDAADTVIYAPLDISFIVRKFIRWIQPVVYLAAETELWPNLYQALYRRNIPIVQVNGRISDKSYRGYQRVSLLLKGMLRCVTMFCMQSASDAEKIACLGADPGRVCVTGNLKFDNLPHASYGHLENLGLQKAHTLWIAGSTHPGEEEIILDVYSSLRLRFPDLRLAICPRHVERVEDLARLAQEKDFIPLQFSRLAQGCWDDARAVVIVDTIGHLRNLYSLAQLVFVGKTLAVGGGQNMIEPAAFGKAVVVGPLTYNFRDVMQIFLRDHAIVQVDTVEGLRLAMENLLTHPEKGREIGQRAKRIVAQYGGATAKTLKIIEDILSKTVHG